MERRIDLSLNELEIQGNSNGTIHIKWSPKEAGCWRDVLQLTDNRRIKYDIIIATTAKDDKKGNKTRRRLKPVRSNSSNLTTSTNRHRQDNILKVPVSQKAIGRFLVNDFDAQVKQCKSKYQSDLNKENILNKNNEAKTCALRAKNDKINETYNEKLENVLCEQNITVWNDGSVLPQVLLPSNEPQDIRRVTYIKEKKPCNNIQCDNEEICVDTEYDKDKAQSDFSILLNKFTFTSADVISNSPRPMRRVSTESTTSQIVDKHKTFDISRSQFFETSAIYDMKTPANAAPVLQPAGLHNLSPIKPDECSLMNDIKNLISSSPIQFPYQIPKDSNHFMVDINPNIQTTDCEYFSFEVIPRNMETTKKIGDMYIEISPPRKHFHSTILSMSKLSSMKTGRVTKNNTLCDGGNRKKLQLSMSAASKLYL